MSDVKLQDIGDVELWGLCAPNICLPAFAQPFQEAGGGRKYILVWPACKLTDEQHTWFYLILEKFALDRHSKYVVFDGNYDLTMCLQRINGYTPERHLKWNGMPMSEVRKEVDADFNVYEFGSAKADAFLLAVHKKTGHSVADLKILWNAMNQIMMEWLAIKKKPIDFLFGTIAPLPYRVNWRSVLLKSFPRSWAIFNHGNKDKAIIARKGAYFRPVPKLVDPVPELATYGVIDGFYTRELLEVHGTRVKTEEIGNHTVGWSLDLIPTQAFHDTTQRVEHGRLHKYGRAVYCRQVSEYISRARNLIIASFRDFVLRSARPFAKLVSTDYGLHIQPCTTWGHRDTRIALAVCEDNPVCDTSDPFANQGLRSLGKREARPVRAVPDVQQKEAHVRNGGPKVDQPANGSEREAGMLVLHAGEESGAGI